MFTYQLFTEKDTYYPIVAIDNDRYTDMLPIETVVQHDLKGDKLEMRLFETSQAAIKHAINELFKHPKGDEIEKIIIRKGGKEMKEWTRFGKKYIELSFKCYELNCILD